MLEKPDGYTGRLLEQEMFSPLPDTWRHQGYFTEQKSYEWVRENQLWNPSDPDNRLANDLHYLVGEKLGLEDFNDLKFYNATNSPLDEYYGIDAFFEIGDARFTLDMTMNSHKQDYKADYVVKEDITTDAGRNDLSKIIAQYLQNDLHRQYVKVA